MEQTKPKPFRRGAPVDLVVAPCKSYGVVAYFSPLAFYKEYGYNPLILAEAT